MSGGLYIGGDTSGSVLLVPTAVAGSTTVTIAAQSGTLNVGGPAFSAYQTSNQNVSSGSWTKITFTTEEFDTNNNFASSTFTPTVAGYYQLNGQVEFLSAISNRLAVSLYKNGTAYKRGTDINNTAYSGLVSSIVYANGTTDYFEIYVYQQAGTTQATDNSYDKANTWFNGCFLRGA